MVCLLLPRCETLGGCNPKKTVHGEKVHRKFRFRAGKGRRLACVAGGIVSASKGMAEELCSRAENGEETLWRMTASPPKLSYAQNQFRQLRRLNATAFWWPGEQIQLISLKIKEQMLKTTILKINLHNHWKLNRSLSSCRFIFGRSGKYHKIL